MTRVDDDVDVVRWLGMEEGWMAWLEGDVVGVWTVGSDSRVVTRLSLRTRVGCCCWAEELGAERCFGVETGRIPSLEDCIVETWTAGSRFTVVT